MTKTTTSGLCAIEMPHDGVAETFLSIPLQAGESSAAPFDRLEAYGHEHPDLRILRQEVFGLSHADHAHRVRQAAWPVTWLEQGGRGSYPAAGLQVQAVRGASVAPIRDGERIVGSVVQDAQSR